MRRIIALGGGDRVRFCKVLDHALIGVVVTARERSRGALGAADEHGPLRVEVLDLEVHSFIHSFGLLISTVWQVRGRMSSPKRNVGVDPLEHRRNGLGLGLGRDAILALQVEVLEHDAFTRAGGAGSRG